MRHQFSLPGIPSDASQVFLGLQQRCILSCEPFTPAQFYVAFLGATDFTTVFLFFLVVSCLYFDSKGFYVR